ncbi:MAG: hypothetical protein RR053_02290 [Evtepia sp.]
MNAILWQENTLSLLDQRKYPEEVWHECVSCRMVADVLKSGAVQGEAILGIAAGYAYCLAAIAQQDINTFDGKAAIAMLLESNDSPAIRRALDRMSKMHEDYRDSPDLMNALLVQAVSIHREDVVACRAMNRTGASIIPEEAQVLLLAHGGIFHTGSHGSALGSIRSAYRKGKIKNVLLCESRPASCEAVWHELTTNEIPVQIVPDHSAATFMARHATDIIIIEGGRVAQNGDLLALTGAYELAIASYFHSIPVYATARLSDVDTAIPDGSGFPLEETSFPSFDGAETQTPTFDVIPNYLLTGFITDKGLIYPDYAENFANSQGKVASLL